MFPRILVAALVVAAQPQICPSQDLSSVERALVTVIARDAGGAVRAQSTGLLLDAEGHVLTSAHAFHGAAATEIRTADGATYRVKAVAAESVPAELIRLVGEAPSGASFPVVRLSEEAPERGAHVTLMRPRRRVEGRVEATRSVPGLATLLQVKSSAGEDLSGAPLVDGNGLVAGVVLWRSRREPDIYVAASADLAGLLHPRPPAAPAEPAACAGDAEPLYRDGVERLIPQEFDEARRDFERATAADPRCAPAWFLLGFALGKLGRPAERFKAYQKAVEVRPDFADARYSLGVACALANRRAEALEQQETLEKLDPELALKLRMLIEAVTHDDPPASPPPGGAATHI